jgi:hypothetical protein
MNQRLTGVNTQHYRLVSVRNDLRQTTRGNLAYRGLASFHVRAKTIANFDMNYTRAFHSPVVDDDDGHILNSTLHWNDYLNIAETVTCQIPSVISPANQMHPFWSNSHTVLHVALLAAAAERDDVPRRAFIVDG